MQTERAAYNANKGKILDAVANLKDGQFARIRCLTTRESFRLMGVSEPEIDLLLSTTKEPVEYEAFNLETGEKTKKKKCNTEADLLKQSGNSIVCDVLTNIFRRCFIDRIEPDKGDSKQLF